MAALAVPLIADLAKDKNTLNAAQNVLSSTLGIVPMLLLGSVGFFIFCIGLIIFSVSSKKAVGAIVAVAGFGIGLLGIGIYILPQIMNARRQTLEAKAGQRKIIKRPLVTPLPTKVPLPTKATLESSLEAPIHKISETKTERVLDENGKLITKAEHGQDAVAASATGGDFTDNMARTFRPAINAFGNTSIGQKINQITIPPGIIGSSEYSY